MRKSTKRQNNKIEKQNKWGCQRGRLCSWGHGRQLRFGEWSMKQQNSPSTAFCIKQSSWDLLSCNAPHLHTESILPSLLLLPPSCLSVCNSLSFCFAPPPIPNSFRERSQTVTWGHHTQRWWIGSRVHRNKAAEGLAEHYSVAWLMGTCIIFLGGIG